jgi:hypothetical protein
VDVADGGDFAGGDTTKPEPTKPEVKPADPIKPETTADALKPEPVKPEVTGTTPDSIATDPSLKPEAVTPKPAKVEPTINATPESAEAAFDKAESAFLTSKDLPLEKQPIDEILKQFEGVSKNDALPESMRRVAESRVVTLKARLSAKTELVKLREGETELKQRQMALEADQQELHKRIAESTVKVYTAVGTLQPSSLQQGAVTLYRITDPATGRTVCYLRSNDAATIKLLGQFVGVRGALHEEARLGAKVITPTELTACDPGKVHLSITAQIIPPSLIPREPATAQTDPQPPQ